MEGLPDSGPRGPSETWRTPESACWEEEQMGVVNVRDRGRGGPGRKEPVEGASYPAPHPPHPWMPGELTTLLTDTDWIPPSVALPLALWEQRCGGLP